MFPNSQSLLPFDARLIGLLRGESMPPSEIGNTLDVTTEKVFLAITRLREAGFEISQHPSLGFRLEAAPDRLLADDILSRMKTDWLLDIMVYEATASTNDLAMKRGIQGASGPLAIFAETQTAGRGRFGRHWISEAREGIWMSLLLRPEIPFVQWPRLTLAAALASSLAVEEITQLKPSVKWPNDLLVQEKKICGLIVETGSHPGNGAFAVLGIGLNANQTQFPDELCERATSLKQIIGEAVDRTALAAALLDNLGQLLPKLGGDFPQILSQIKQRSTLLGKALKLNLGGRIVSGIAEDLTQEGLLSLRFSDGSVQHFSAGEVSVEKS